MVCMIRHVCISVFVYTGVVLIYCQSTEMIQELIYMYCVRYAIV